MTTLVRRLLDRAIQGPQPPVLVHIPQHRGGRHPDDWPAPAEGQAHPREQAAVARREALR